jgi:hypothetical protein
MRVQLVSIAAALVVIVGCTTRSEPISQAGLPMVTNTPVAAPQQVDQTLRVTVLDGRFASSTYEELPGATHMLVITAGGPYVFEIDKLVAKREIAADAQTVIIYDLSAPGQYTMRAYRSTATGTSPDFASAVLEVRTVGGN